MISQIIKGKPRKKEEKKVSFPTLNTILHLTISINRAIYKTHTELVVLAAKGEENLGSWGRR